VDFWSSFYITCLLWIFLTKSIEVVIKAMTSIAVNITAQLVKSKSLPASMPYLIATSALTVTATIKDTIVIPAAVPMARRFLFFWAGFRLFMRLKITMVAMPAVSEYTTDSATGLTLAKIADRVVGVVMLNDTFWVCCSTRPVQALKIAHSPCPIMFELDMAVVVW
jgi:hypothetical protein